MTDDVDQLTSRHVRRAVDGDRESLAWVVERFSPVLLAQANYRLGESLRRFCEPHDLVNDVWVRALPRLGAIDVDEGRFTPVVLKYLTTTLLHRIRDLFEKHVLGKPRADAGSGNPIADLADDISGVVTRVVRAEIRSRIFRAIDELPEADRAVMVLRSIEQRSTRQVAGLLGISEEATSSRHRRALQKLEQHLPECMFGEASETDVALRR